MASVDAPTVSILPGSGLPAGTSQMSSVFMCKPFSQRRPVECLAHICSECTTKARLLQPDGLKPRKRGASSRGESSLVSAPEGKHLCGRFLARLVRARAIVAYFAV